VRTSSEGDRGGRVADGEQRGAGRHEDGRGEGERETFVEGEDLVEVGRGRGVGDAVWPRAWKDNGVGHGEREREGLPNLNAESMYKRL
jgi:hypothetical protein